MSRLNLSIILLATCISTQAQEYFQQDVKYSIEVTLDDKKHMLHGALGVEYTNNSPDELTFLWFHIWPNAYKDNTTALAQQLMENDNLDFYWSKPEDRGYIDSLEFAVNMNTVNWQYHPEHKDIVKLILNEPLKPGQTATIATPFRVKIPDARFSRLGHVGESYMITQWYPKPAVYDRDGWHPMPYLTQGEFYSEFGSFDVTITLPKNYVVGATGDCQTTEEVEWMEYLADKTASKTTFGPDNAFPESSKEMKTIVFHQDNVHDFGWFADKRFNVLKGQVSLPYSQRIVTTWALFTNDNPSIWDRSLEYINDAVYYYSLWTGEYPYNHMTAVDGTISAGSGMEYPNVTVVAADSPLALETVIMHEVGHNWFYGMLGSNERDHPWLDEGLNSFTENRYIEHKYPDANMLESFVQGGTKLLNFLDVKSLSHKGMYDIGYQLTGRKNMDQPIELPAGEYVPINYGAIVYGKTALVFDYLMAYLGTKVYDKCMQAYFEKWKFKHPGPQDIRKVFEETSGKNLGWLFDDLINTTKKLDYKILKAEKASTGDAAKPEGWQVTVKNTGDIMGPFAISGIQKGVVKNTKWYEGVEGTTTVQFPKGDYTHFVIDGTLDMPEMHRKNNTYKTKGLFKKMEPMDLQPIGSLEDPKKTQLYYSPIAGWNKYDKWMVGLALYNNKMPARNLDWMLAPMYSIDEGTAVGSAYLNYHIYPKGNAIQRITFGADYRSFSQHLVGAVPDDLPYFRVKPQVELQLKKKRARGNYEHTFNASNTFIQALLGVPGAQDSIDNYTELRYTLRNDHAITPWYIGSHTQYSDDLLKTSLTAGLSWQYHRNAHIDIRAFGGTFLDYPTQHPRFNWHMTGRTGRTDYTYDQLFLGRTEDEYLLSQQFAETEGAFKINAGPVGRSSEWIAAANIKIKAPLPLGIGVFADAGAYPFEYIEAASQQRFKETEVLYNAGVYINLLPQDLLTVYVPLTFSQQFKDYMNVQGFGIWESMRFTLHLNSMNPVKLVQQIEF